MNQFHYGHEEPETLRLRRELASRKSMVASALEDLMETEIALARAIREEAMVMTSTHPGLNPKGKRTA